MGNVIQEYVVSLVGSIDDASFKQLDKAIKKVQSLAEKTAESLAKYVQSTTEAGKESKETGKTVDDSAKSFSRFADSAKRGANETRLFSAAMTGMKVVTLKTMLDIGKKAWSIAKGPLTDFYESFKKTAGAKAGITAIEKSMKSLNTTAGNALQWISHHLVSMITGPLKRFQETFSKLNKGMTVNMPQWTKAIALVLSAFVRGADVVMRIAGKIMEWLGRIPEPIRNIGLAFVALGLLVKSGPMGWIITGISAVLLLLDDFFTYLDGGNSLFGGFWGELLKWIKIIEPGVKELFNSFIVGAQFVIDGLTWIFNLIGPKGVAIIAGVTSAVWLLNVAMNANPIGLIVIGVLALITVIGQVIKYFPIIKEWAIKSFQAIADKVSSVASWFSEKFGAAKDAVVGIFNTIKTKGRAAIQSVLNKVSGVGAWFSEKFGAAKEAAVGVYTDITTAFSEIGTWFGERFGAAKEAIVTAFSPVTDFVSGVWDTITGLFNGEITLESLVQGMVDGAAGVITGWLTDLGNIGPNLLEAIGTGIDNIKESFKEKISGVFGWVAKLFPHSDAEEGPFSNLSGSGAALIDTFADGAAGQKDSFGTKLSGVLSGAWDTAKNALGGAWDWFSGLFSDAESSADEEMGNMSDDATTRKSEITDAFDGMDDEIGGEFSSAAQKAMEAWSGVGEYFAGVVAGIKGIITSISSEVKFTFSSMSKSGSGPVSGGKIAAHANGGITDRPTISGLSEDGGREYIIPINKPARAWELISGAINDLVGGGGKSAHGAANMSPAIASATQKTVNQSVNAPANFYIYGATDPKSTAESVSGAYTEHVYDSAEGVFA